MKHSTEVRVIHSRPGTNVRDVDILPADPRHPDIAFIQREIDYDIKHEWVLIPKAIIAVGVVLVLVLIRQLYFV